MSPVVIEARRLARCEVKADLRRKGIKPQFLAAKTITLLANTYLEEHPGLIEEARGRVERWRLLKRATPMDDLHWRGSDPNRGATHG